MNDAEVGKHWDQNADAWTTLSRAGYDIYRDHLNTPAFLQMLPNIAGLRGLDIGCGEGTNTQQLARLGAAMTGIDISPRFIEHATDSERRAPSGVIYHVASAQRLPFAEASFDFCTAFMSMMDLPNQSQALSEAFRVLKPSGFLQFSITHPCFDTPHRRNLRDESKRTYAIEVGGYFDNIDGRIDRWIFGAAPLELRSQFKPFEVPRFHRTISEWVNLISEAGLVIERMNEPRVSESLARTMPSLQDTRVVAYFLHIRCRKPA